MSECCASIACYRVTSESDESGASDVSDESADCYDYDGVEQLEVACSHPGLRSWDMAAAVARRECKMDVVDLVYRLQELEHTRWVEAVQMVLGGFQMMVLAAVLDRSSLVLVAAEAERLLAARRSFLERISSKR